MSKEPSYDRHNPHPLSQIGTELIWEGKYDECGDRRELDFASLSMPSQLVEAIDEPREGIKESLQIPIPLLN